MLWRSETRGDDAPGDEKDGSGDDHAEDGTPANGPCDKDEGNDLADDLQEQRVANILTSSLLSPSKRAVHLMNATSGLCADPLHFHSFATVGSGWVPTPKSLFVGAFQKCVACHGRLGGRASVTCCSPEGDDAGASAEMSNSSSQGMLQCVACGAYAHRSCAFARPTTIDWRTTGNVPPLCEVNLVEIQKAFGISGKQMHKQMGAPQAQPEVEPNDTTQPNAESQSSSWSIFGKISTKKDAIDDSVLEEKKEPEPSEAPPEPTKPPGVLQTSFQLIQKTTETTRAIPKASAIGMVAGGAAGLAIAGPAGVIVGSQIGRTVLAAGAAVEGGLAVSALVLSLAAAANFSSHLSLPSSSEKERQLKLNSTLVLVRPDIDVDPVWGEWAEEARKFWTEKNKETADSSGGSFGLGNLFNSSPGKDEREMRYRKDSDIVKADASELPMKEKVFLLVNRILNDKMSLPGYQYRYLILKHKRRTMFGDEGNTGDDEGHSIRSCRRDAHGVIKHVTATLLEVRPGLAASPAMTELSASAVEALVFGDLYDDVFREITQQTEEKDESLLAKVNELQSKRKEERSQQSDGEATLVSQRAIRALRALPQAHTPTEKLRHCVEFLECVSFHFSSLFEGKCIDADTLLIMVCQHVVSANVPHLHAEVAFVEEFSRDEQLLSGKEGYALITLQASLHYLDSLEELPSDISPALSFESDVGQKRRELI